MLTYNGVEMEWRNAIEFNKNYEEKESFSSLRQVKVAIKTKFVRSSEFAIDI